MYPQDAQSPVVPTTSELLHSFEQYLQDTKRMLPSTIRDYCRYTRKFLEFLSPKQITDLQDGDLNAYQSFLLTQGVRDNSSKSHVMSIQRFLEFLAEEWQIRVLVNDLTIPLQRRLKFLLPLDQELLTVTRHYLSSRWTIERVNFLQATVQQFLELTRKDLTSIEDADIHGFKTYLRSEQYSANGVRDKTRFVRTCLNTLQCDLGISLENQDTARQSLDEYSRFRERVDLAHQQKWLSQFYDYLQNKRGISSHSARWYCRFLERFVTLLRKDLLSLADGDAHTFRTIAARFPIPSSTMKYTFTVVRQFVRFLAEEHHSSIRISELTPLTIVKNERLSSRNRQLIDDLTMYLEEERYSASMIETTTNCLKSFAGFLQQSQRNLDAVASGDIHAYQAYLRREDRHKTNVQGVIPALRHFVHFLEKEEGRCLVLDELKWKWQRDFDNISPTNQTYLTDFVAYLQNEKECCASTIHEYRCSILQFLLYTKKDMDTIQHGDIHAYKRYHKGRNIHAKTINRYLKTLEVFLTFLRQHYQLDLPIKKIKLIRVQQQQFLEHYISKSDFERLIRATERHHDLRAKALISTFFLTGARRSEVKGLPPSVVNHTSVTIYGKGGKSRKLLIPKRLNAVWQEYVKACPDVREAEFLFPGRRSGTSISHAAIDTLLKYYAGQARLNKAKVHPHNFRHGFAVQLDKKGFTLTEIADLLGHSDINTTRIYQKRTEQEIQQKLDKFL
jgi:integrase/recombinase XerD